MQRITRILALTCLLAVCSACVGNVQMQTPPPALHSETLGEGQGTGVSTLLFGIIPIGQTGRHQRAYDEAIQTKGGNSISDPSVRERWFWTPIGPWFVTTVRGNVIR